MEYTEYSAEDFALDDSFIRWVKGIDAHENDQWDHWLANHPEKKPEVYEAMRLINLMNFQESVRSEEKVEEIRESIHSKINPNNRGHGSKIRALGSFNHSIPYFRAAAAVIGILMMIGAAGYLYFNVDNKTVIHETAYNETQTILLPDQSQVTLNANSKLVYDDNWADHNERVVKLEGEAYFEVEEQQTSAHPSGKKFIVQAGDLDVEVVGTAFNVNNRHGETKVVLTSGKILLKLPKILSNDSKDTLAMQPGELVAYSKNDHDITKKMVNPEIYASWRENVLNLEETKLSTIAQIIEDYYGYQVEIQDEELSERTLTGSIPTKDLDIFLEMLAKSIDVKIKKGKNEIIIAKNN